MEKAKLIIHGETDKETRVLFNPEEYNLSRSVNYAKLAVPGLDNPIMQFIGGGQTSLTVTLHIDTLNDFVPKGSSADVRDHTKAILDALWIDGKIHSPPAVTFIWGTFSFKGVISDAKQSFTMFLPDGTPVRSKLDLTFQSIQKLRDARKKSPFESPDREKARYAERETALWYLSYKEYGHPKYWRLIAEANKIYNPRKCPTGRLLRLPPLTSENL